MIVLQSFTLCADGTNLGDGTGVAMAEGLMCNTALQSFTLHADDTQLGDRAGQAMVEALQHNTVVHSFTLDASDTNLGDRAGLACATPRCSPSLCMQMTLSLVTAQVKLWPRR